MEYLGIDLSCAVGSLRHGQLPEKDCLLPLISKLLGYAIVAASTTVKLPQALVVNRFLQFFFTFAACVSFIMQIFCLLLKTALGVRVRVLFCSVR